MLDRDKYLLSTPAALRYDVTPDGPRFPLLKPVTKAGAGVRVVVVENWYEELKRLVPTQQTRNDSNWPKPTWDAVQWLLSGWLRAEVSAPGRGTEW